ncbi:hypothetical protein FBULB1_5092 [Fusarium bulbicola]|nr:hypothetical protein FBULB1_5092 [Fusarium bulbicola]
MASQQSTGAEESQHCPRDGNRGGLAGNDGRGDQDGSHSDGQHGGEHLQGPPPPPPPPPPQAPGNTMNRPSTDHYGPPPPPSPQAVGNASDGNSQVRLPPIRMAPNSPPVDHCGPPPPPPSVASSPSGQYPSPQTVPSGQPHSNQPVPYGPFNLPPRFSAVQWRPPSPPPQHSQFDQLYHPFQHSQLSQLSQLLNPLSQLYQTQDASYNNGNGEKGSEKRGKKRKADTYQGPSADSRGVWPPTPKDLFTTLEPLFNHLNIEEINCRCKYSQSNETWSFRVRKSHSEIEVDITIKDVTRDNPVVAETGDTPNKTAPTEAGAGSSGQGPHKILLGTPLQKPSDIWTTEDRNTHW